MWTYEAISCWITSLANIDQHCVFWLAVTLQSAKRMTLTVLLFVIFLLQILGCSLYICTLCICSKLQPLSLSYPSQMIYFYPWKEGTEALRNSEDPTNGTKYFPECLLMLLFSFLKKILTQKDVWNNAVTLYYKILIPLTKCLITALGIDTR